MASRLYRDHAVVLRTWKLGEADRIVVLLTREHGKVRGVAKGVRKTRSSFGSRLEPGSHVAVQLHQGRELDVVTQAERLDTFRSLREDLDRVGRAAAVLEAIDQLAQDRHPDERLYEMLLGALRALDERNSPALVATFFLKVLAHEGLGPEVDACVECGATEELVAFDLVAGGVRCRDHRSGVALSAATLDLLQRTLGGRLASVLDEPASPAVDDLESLATRLVEQHVERRLKTLPTLDA
jgi:DNA repair protein RecO (recombination protein O)